MEPLAPTRYQIRFTASGELRDRLERPQALMRSSPPDGDPAVGGAISIAQPSANDLFLVCGCR